MGSAFACRDELVITVAAVTNAVGNQALLELPIGLEVVGTMSETALVFVSLPSRGPDVIRAAFWVKEFVLVACPTGVLLPGLTNPSVVVWLASACAVDDPASPAVALPAADGKDVVVCCSNGSDEIFEVTAGRFTVVVDGSCPVMVGDVTITLVGSADVACIVVPSPCPRVVVGGGG